MLSTIIKLLGFYLGSSDVRFKITFEIFFLMDRLLGKPDLSMSKCSVPPPSVHGTQHHLSVTSDGPDDSRRSNAHRQWSSLIIKGHNVIGSQTQLRFLCNIRRQHCGVIFPTYSSLLPIIQAILATNISSDASSMLS